MRGTTALLLMLVVACGSSAASAGNQTSPVLHRYAGGCAGTALTDAVPPKWAQGGWTHTIGPWPVAWAMGTGGGAIAFVFAGQLVAGGSPRIDGSNNKVLWVIRDHAPTFTVEGRPRGQPYPVLTVEAGPSIVDAPTAGCWTFAVDWKASGPHTSTINLEVLPKGSLPLTSPAS